eukprot:6175493-Pleurochrysis_carterae.AAC.1
MPVSKFEPSKTSVTMFATCASETHTRQAAVNEVIIHSNRLQLSGDSSPSAAAPLLPPLSLAAMPHRRQAHSPPHCLVENGLFSSSRKLQRVIPGDRKLQRGNSRGDIRTV